MQVNNGPIEGDNCLYNAIESALKQVVKCFDQPLAELPLVKKLSVIHKDRSSCFLELLHKELSLAFSNETCEVFSKARKNLQFVRSEYLYDIMVANYKGVSSPFSGREIHVVTDAVVLIESEFARDVKQTMIDFSKLICGLAPTKMMIMPMYNKDQDINNWLIEHVFTDEMRTHDKAIYYLTYIEHPEYWNEERTPHFKMFKCGEQTVTPVNPCLAIS